MTDYVALISEINPEAYVMDGYDDCIIGLSTTDLLVYSRDKILESLQATQEMTMEEAIEWYEYNMVRGLDYLGERAPIFCQEQDD